jgi:membrane-associated phospholipid phosphatase
MAAIASSPIHRIAHFVSYLLHPAILMLTTIALLSYSAGSASWQIALDVVIIMLGITPGLAYIIIKTRRGETTHYHLLLKEERYIVFPIMIAGLVASLALSYALGRPAIINQGIIWGLIVGTGAAIINRFWKISLHAAVGGGCAALLLPVSLPLMSFVLILAIISGLARLPIRHHTVAQVIIGWLYGFGLTAILFWVASSR